MTEQTPLIAVTGATGEIGGRVARALAAEGARTRLVVRDPARAPELPGASVAVASYGDGGAMRDALVGADALLLVSGTESPDRLAEHATAIEAAASAGVRSVVYTSFLGAAPDATFTHARDHAATEALLRGSGMAWTFLRDNFYLDVLEHFVGEDDAIRGPARDGVASFVARADVAAVAATVLRDPAAHAGRTYDLTGGEALSMADAARTIGEVRGRDVRFVDETVEEAYASRAAWNPAPWEADAWVSTYTAIAAGELAAISPDLPALLGRAPLTLEQVLRGEG